MEREKLTLLLERYHSPYPEELAFRDPMLDLLQHPRCFHRDHLPGHFTGSAWITDPSGTSALLVLHAKLNKWLQPGGHADGDEDLMRVALREAEEETGLKNLAPGTGYFFDIDIHPIPARKGFPEHLHYDVRFHFTASPTETLVISEESLALKWVPLNNLEKYVSPPSSLFRLAQKTALS